MRRLQYVLNAILIAIPLAVLFAYAYHFAGRLSTYLFTGRRMAGVISQEATRLLGREVRIADIRLTGNLFNLYAHNRLDVFGIRVEQGPTPIGGRFATAEEVSIWYSLAQALLDTDPRVPIIDALSVRRPSGAMARSATGRWNFQQFISKPTVPGRPFAGKITVVDGTVYYADADMPHPAETPARPLATRVDRLDGVVLMRPDKSIAFQVATAGPVGFMASVDAAGVVQPGRTSAAVSLTASGIRLPSLAGRALYPKLARLTSGTADLRANLVYTPPAGTIGWTADPAAVQATGSLHVADLTAVVGLFGVPIEHVNGDLTITPGTMAAHLGGSYSGMDWTAGGFVYGLPIGWPVPRGAKAPPIVNLSGTLRNGNFHRIIRTVDAKPWFKRLGPETDHWLEVISGVANVNYQVDGQITNPFAVASAYLPRAGVDTYFGEQLRARISYADHELTTDLRGLYALGQTAIRARIALDEQGKFEVEGHGRGLQLARLGVPLNKPLSGTGNVDLAIRGQKGRTPSITAQAQVSDGAYDGMPVHSLYAKADTVGRDLVVRTLRIQDPKGFVLINGTIGLASRRLGLRVEVDDADIGDMGELIQHAATAQRPAPEPLRPVEGVGYLRATVGGTFRQPTASGQADVFALAAGSLGLDRLSMTFDMTPERLDVHTAAATRYPGVARFAGTVLHPLTSRPEFQLQGSADHFDLPDLLRMGGIETPQVALAGEVSISDVAVQGTLDDIRLLQPASITLSDVTANDLAVDSASAELSYGPSGLSIMNAMAKTATGAVTASGTVSKSGDLNMAFSGTGLNLADLTAAMPAENGEITVPAIDGTLNVRGTFQGTSKAPAIELSSIAARDVSFNAVAIGDIQASARYAGGILSLQHAAVSDPVNPAGTITVAGFTYNTATKELATAAPIQIQNLSLARINELAVRSLAGTSGGALQNVLGYAGELSGTLSATIAISGTPKAPQAELTWSTRNLAFENHSILLFSGSARADTKSITLPSPATPTMIGRIELAAGTAAPALIQATKVVYVYGHDVDADVDAYHVPLGTIQSYVPALSRAPFHIVGTADVIGITATGPLSAPDVDSSITLSNVGITDVKTGATWSVDRLQTSSIHLRQGSADVGLVELTKSVGSGTATEAYHATLTGSVGFSWHAPFIPADAPVDVHLSVPKQNIRGLAAMASLPLGSSVGTLAVAAALGGTRANLRVTGSLSVNAPQLRFGAYSTGLQNLAGTVTFAQDHIIADVRATPHVFPSGPVKEATGTPFTITGTLPIGLASTQGASSNALAIDCDQFVYGEPTLPDVQGGNIRGVATIHLAVAHSAVDPVLAGALTLHDATFALPHGFNTPAGSRVPLPSVPAFQNVTLRIGDNVKITSSLVNATVRGAITANGDLRAPQLDGRITLVSGRIRLPTVAFTVDQGSLALTYPVIGPANTQTLGLTVDMTLETHITAASVSGQETYYRVFVTARGPVLGDITNPLTGAPRLALSIRTEPPDLALAPASLEDRLAGLLAGTGANSGVSHNAGNAFEGELIDVLTGSLLPPILSAPAQALGLEDLAFNYNPIFGWSFTVSRQLFGPFYVTYFRSLAATPTSSIYDLMLSFRFKTNYQISLETDEQETYRLLLEGVWRF